MQEKQIRALIQKQRDFFSQGKTFSFGFRKEALRRLQKGIAKYEAQICRALRTDLGKSREESYFCEVGMVLREIGEKGGDISVQEVPSGGIRES